jgi:hypothetical protein
MNDDRYLRDYPSLYEREDRWGKAEERLDSFYSRPGAWLVTGDECQGCEGTGQRFEDTIADEVAVSIPFRCHECEGTGRVLCAKCYENRPKRLCDLCAKRGET